MDFFPVLFAVPRVVGWLAHWRQMMHQQGGVKIWRPRQVGIEFELFPNHHFLPHGFPEMPMLNRFVQLYVGPGKRDYLPIYKRLEETNPDPKSTPIAVPHSGSVLLFSRRTCTLFWTDVVGASFLDKVSARSLQNI
jgi:citrate synthase